MVLSILFDNLCISRAALLASSSDRWSRLSCVKEKKKKKKTLFVVTKNIWLILNTVFSNYFKDVLFYSKSETRKRNNKNREKAKEMPIHLIQKVMYNGEI